MAVTYVYCRISFFRNKSAGFRLCYFTLYYLCDFRYFFFNSFIKKISEKQLIHFISVKKILKSEFMLKTSISDMISMRGGNNDEKEERSERS